MTPERWRQIEELYHSAHERGPAALANADPELRAEVERLLAQDSSGKILDRPAAELQAGLTAARFVSGSQLGPYRIEAPLGAGGMGEVFRAIDTRLGRAVALKTYREQFTERFHREARAISALNHPHICTLYDVGPNYLVMELVDGETLAARLKNGKLSVEETLQFGEQIADALAAAHAKGIVHRDLKPGNIMLTQFGVKVLDFGIAKLSDDETLTASRAVIGTPAYMAPEQRDGKSCDARTDIYGLGLVLYEMATGKRPAPGELLASSSLPGELSWIIQGCLVSDPEFRRQSAHDLSLDLRAARQMATPEPRPSSRLPQIFRRTGAAAASSTASLPRHNRVRRQLAWVLAAITLAALAIGLYKWRSPVAPTSDRMRITRISTAGHISSAVISADGRYMAYAILDGATQGLSLRQLATGSDVPLIPAAVAGGDRALFSPLPRYWGLSFSPDGNYIYYLQKDGVVNTLYRMPSLGGAARKLVVDVDSGVTFSPDGVRMVFMRRNTRAGETAILSANTDGSDERRLAVHIGPGGIGSPAWSPDGKTIACVASGPDPSGRYETVVTFPAQGGSPKAATTYKWRAVSAVAWVSDGRELVLAATEDSHSPSQIWSLSYPGGRARPITNDLSSYSGVSVTVDSAALLTVQEDRASSLWVLKSGNPGSAVQITSGARSDDGTYGIAWTPDRKIVYTSQTGGNQEIWITDADGSNRKPLTIESGANGYPAVSPDGRYVVFSSNRDGAYRIMRMDPDGANLKQLTSGRSVTDPSFTPAGDSVVYATYASGYTIMKVPTAGGTPEPLSSTRGLYALRPAISPDGKMIAFIYRPNETPTRQAVAVMPLEPGAAPRIFTISTAFVRWTRDGSGLTYIDMRRGGSNIWEQPLGGGVPKQVTDFTGGRIFSFDWSQDGKELAVARGEENSDAVLIRNFK